MNGCAYFAFCVYDDPVCVLDSDDPAFFDWPGLLFGFDGPSTPDILCAVLDTDDPDCLDWPGKLFGFDGPTSRHWP